MADPSDNRLTGLFTSVDDGPGPAVVAQPVEHDGPGEPTRARHNRGRRVQVAGVVAAVAVASALLLTGARRGAGDMEPAPLAPAGPLTPERGAETPRASANHPHARRQRRRKAPRRASVASAPGPYRAPTPAPADAGVVPAAPALPPASRVPRASSPPAAPESDEFF